MFLSPDLDLHLDLPLLGVDVDLIFPSQDHGLFFFLSESRPLAQRSDGLTITLETFVYLYKNLNTPPVHARVIL